MPAVWTAGGSLTSTVTKSGKRVFIITEKGEAMNLGKKGTKLTYSDAVERAKKAGIDYGSGNTTKVPKPKKAKTTPETTNTQPAPETANPQPKKQTAQPKVSKANVQAEMIKRKAAQKLAKAAKAKATAK